MNQKISKCTAKFYPGKCAMKISLRYHNLLIYDVKRSTNTDGMGPFNLESGLTLATK